MAGFDASPLSSTDAHPPPQTHTTPSSAVGNTGSAKEWYLSSCIFEHCDDHDIMRFMLKSRRLGDTSAPPSALQRCKESLESAFRRQVSVKTPEEEAFGKFIGDLQQGQSAGIVFGMDEGGEAWTFSDEDNEREATHHDTLAAWRNGARDAIYARVVIWSSSDDQSPSVEDEGSDVLET